MPWYELNSSDDPKLQELAERYHLHPLHIEDVRSADERVKVEHVGGRIGHLIGGQLGLAPVGRLLRLGDVHAQQLADQILFMCSPRGKTISGQAISICGDTQMLG